MNCREFWRRMPELAQELHPDLLEHVSRCAACGALLKRHDAVAAGLRTVAAELRRTAAPERVETELVAAFRLQAGSAVGRSPGRPRTLRLAWVLATAAMVILGLFLAPDRQPAGPMTGGRTLASIDVAGMPAALGAELEEPAAVSDGDFIPLPNAARLGPNEDLNLVRVEVPRSTMIALGFAVNEERDAEPVQADVVLGSDGLVQAVRFVQ